MIRRAIGRMLLWFTDAARPRPHAVTLHHADLPCQCDQAVTASEVSLEDWRAMSEAIRDGIERVLSRRDCHGHDGSVGCGNATVGEGGEAVMASPPSAPAPPLNVELPGAGEMQANADIVEGYMSSLVQQIWPGNPPRLSARIDGPFVQLTVEFLAPGEAA